MFIKLGTSLLYVSLVCGTNTVIKNIAFFRKNRVKRKSVYKVEYRFALCISALWYKHSN